MCPAVTIYERGTQRGWQLSRCLSGGKTGEPQCWSSVDDEIGSVQCAWLLCMPEGVQCAMITPDQAGAMRLWELIDSGLVDGKAAVLWADEQIADYSGPAPAWLIEIALAKSEPAMLAELRAFAYGSRQQPDFQMHESYHVGCLFGRYTRGELSWASFLRLAGENADSRDLGVPCEYFYEMLNEVEDLEFSLEVERRQRALVRQRFGEMIGMVQRDYLQFRKLRYGKLLV